MGTPRSPIWIVFCAIVLLLVADSCSSAATPTETLVVGSTECLDCAQKNIKSENAAKGLRVVIKCKVSNEKYETKSVGVVDANGNFNVELPSDLLQTNGELKQECFTQLHSAPNVPCPDKNGLASPSDKLILKSKGIFATSGKLFFASATCVSATFLPPYKDPWHKDPWHKYPKYKYKFPPFHFKHDYDHHDFPPKHDYDHHDFPPKHDYDHHDFDHHDIPPKHDFDHHDIPPKHDFDKPPSGGYYNPPTPTYKPEPMYKKPPSGGYYNPPTPTYKPEPTYKPPSGGYYNPPAAPKYKPTTELHYKDPIFEHPKYKHPIHKHPKFGYPPIHKKLPSWPPHSEASDEKP